MNFNLIEVVANVDNRDVQMWVRNERDHRDFEMKVENEGNKKGQDESWE